MPLPLEGTVFVSVNDPDKDDLEEFAKGFIELGFKIISTKGTAAALQQYGIHARQVNKLYEGNSVILDLIASGEINFIINTPSSRKSSQDDSYIRKAAIKHRTPIITTTAGAKAAVKGIAERRQSNIGVKSLQQYHNEVVE